VENSAHIQPPLTSPDVHDFALGYGASRAAGSVRVAWLLENAALDQGWPIGASLGSEADFIERFAAGRDAVRGAIRILEARGLMRMRRGCKGGLRLLRPARDQAAGALATYLQASGYCREQLDIAVSVLAPVLEELGGGAGWRQLWNRISVLLSEDLPAGAIAGGRAETVAIELLRHVGTPIPKAGVSLGCEAELRAAYGLGHRTFRQALCILDDLGMLQVKRGRGGGYGLKRPAPIGVMHRLFALLASLGTRGQDVQPVIWALCIAILRLAFRRMEALDAGQRAEQCDRLAATLHGLTGMRRWVIFQKGLTLIADDLFLSTMTSSMLAYLARVGPRAPGNDGCDGRLSDAEQAILRALRNGLPAEAEGQLRAVQAYLSGEGCGTGALLGRPIGNQHPADSV
jgi:DNA-binding FadR family transcriptional regulator